MDERNGRALVICVGRGRIPEKLDQLSRPTIAGVGLYAMPIGGSVQRARMRRYNSVVAWFSRGTFARREVRVSLLINRGSPNRPGGGGVLST